MGEKRTVEIDLEAVELTVEGSCLKETDHLAVAGWFKVRLPDGRTVEAAGRWDNPWVEGAYMLETVTVDGARVEEVDEDGCARIPLGDRTVCAEDIAWALLEEG